MSESRVFGKSTIEAAEKERARLAALDEFDILDTPRDEAFERIVRLIKNIFSVDIAIVSMIDGHRQWYKAVDGLNNSEVAREDTFCKYTLDLDAPMIVADASLDERFKANPAVTGDMNVRFYASAPMQTKDGFNIGTVCAIDKRPRRFSPKETEILADLAQMAMDRLELLKFASTDGLTGALTRRAFREESNQQISLAMRHHHGLSCIVFDLDFFKKINDTYGHAAGDTVLIKTVETCMANLRKGDLFGRLGGEEFAVILPHADAEAVMLVAEKLRAAIAALEFEFGGKTVHVTSSFGVSSIGLVTKDIETLLANADTALYQAKAAGRNRCIAWRIVAAADPSQVRRRVLKAGSIIFNNRRSTIDCTVKSLADLSAGLAVSHSGGIPKEFILAIRADGFETPCRVIAQDERNLEVEFC